MSDLQASRGGVEELQAQLEGQQAQAGQQEAEKDQQLARLREDAVSQSQLLDSCQSRVRTARLSTHCVAMAPVRCYDVIQLCGMLVRASRKV